jgi:AraC family transcriptional regulator of adaptative response/methylated-DNA-[protein]-cysteine methyltransferase
MDRPTVREMERASLRRDAGYDGIFFVAVKTTRIFCRPSCSARKPLAKNVEYYHSAREALFAGYRPCKRCHPLNTNSQPPEWVHRLLAMIERKPTDRYADRHLRALGIDPAKARRYFMKTYGMTFQAYARGRRLGSSLQQIRLGTDLDDVILGTGYSSHSGFREAFGKLFGKPPGKSRTEDCIVVTWIESPLGALLAGATSKGVCLLEFTDRRMLEAQFETLRRRFKKAVVPGENDLLHQLKRELSEYFAAKRKSFSVSLLYPGTPFQERVWKELLKIPYGTTVSYEEIARRVGSPKAVRAVGTANGLNRIAIVIPCHRVVNKSGELGGYGGGVWRKKLLLDLERGKSINDKHAGSGRQRNISKTPDSSPSRC